MKLLSCFWLAVAIGGGLGAPAARAQAIPNSSFDTWVTRGGVEAPQGWQTTDDLLHLAGTGFATNTVTKSTTAHSGAFAAQLQTQTLLGFGTLPALLILGNSVNSSSTLLGGVPFTARPGSLQFYYRLSGAQALADSAAVIVLLTRTVGGTAQPVAGGQYTFTAVAGSYTQVALPLQYVSGLAPDSARVVFFSGTGRTFTAATTLLIDDVSFSGSVVSAVTVAGAGAAISISPNPSPDGRYLLQSPEPDLLAAPLTVLDATGRVVRREAPPFPAGRTTRPLDLNDLPAGCYTVQLLTPQGVLVRKLVR